MDTSYSDMSDAQIIPIDRGRAERVSVLDDDGFMAAYAKAIQEDRERAQALHPSSKPLLSHPPLTLLKL